MSATSHESYIRPTHLVHAEGRWYLANVSREALLSQTEDWWFTPSGAAICPVGAEGYAEPLPASSRRLGTESGPDGRWRVTGLPGLRQLILRVSQWRHVKRGRTYTVIGQAYVRGALSEEQGHMAIVYADPAGTLNVREWNEFHDGRFERTDETEAAS